MKVLVAGIAVVLLTAGCAADKPVSPLDGGVAISVVTQPPPEIRVPTGYELYDGTTEGFQLVLPTGWTTFGPDDLDYGEFFEGAEDEVDLGGLEQELASGFDQGGVLMAFDFENSPPEFVDNANVLRVPATPLSPSGYAKVITQQFEGFGATDVVAEVVTVPAGEAVRLTYELPQFGNVGYSLTVPGDEWDWAITISVSDPKTMTVNPDAVFDSFRVVP